LALVDVNYKFMVADIGGCGKWSDGGIFSNSGFGEHSEECRLNIPEPRHEPNSTEAYPFIIVGDKAFPLKLNLLWPYLGNAAPDDEGK
jgi:hypothetical protein